MARSLSANISSTNRNVLPPAPLGVGGSQATRAPNADELCARIRDISTLPHVALRVLEVANSPNSGPRELKQVMESDAALTTRVLRCVNSSAYALRTQISNLQHAVTYLGMQQVRNLALTASVSQLFGNSETIGA
jgi:HD-like signal output (HDOD) protein